MQIRKPIQTAVGFLTYRDCFSLDCVEIPDLGTLKLIGELNSVSVTDFKPPIGWEEAEDVPCNLTFHNVLGFQMLELDTWHDQNADDNSITESSFDEIVESNFLRNIRGPGTKLKPNHKHYQCITYDDVFDVIATGFTFQVGDECPKKN